MNLNKGLELKMANISKKDIQTFGRILKSIGATIEKRPDKLLSMIIDVIESKDNPSNKSDNEKLSLPIDDIDLYSYAKEHDKNDVLEFLMELKVDELKLLIKKYNLGYTKLRAKKSIAEYIADQMKKRTTDVFLKHEK